MIKRLNRLAHMAMPQMQPAVMYLTDVSRFFARQINFVVTPHAQTAIPWANSYIIYLIGLSMIANHSLVSSGILGAHCRVPSRLDKP